MERNRVDDDLMTLADARGQLRKSIAAEAQKRVVARDGHG
jgi:hypothetical protein